MQLGKVKPTATIVAQFAAGVEVEAIQHEGKIFLPAIHIGEFGAVEVAPARKGEPAPEAPAKKPEPAAPAAKPASAPASAAPAPSKKYTKDEMMEMPSKDLEKILRKEFGIDPDEYDGKNTNKKLRDLILEAQSKGGAKSAPAAEDEPEETAEETEETDAEVVKKVTDALSGFDSGKLSRKKAVFAILDACGTDDSDAVNDLLDKFEDDGDVTPEDFAKTIVDELVGEGGEAEGEDVEISDLAKGDRVNVWWNDDNQEWYTGVVDSVKRGKVHVKYDDGTDADLDPEIHTAIKRL